MSKMSESLARSNAAARSATTKKYNQVKYHKNDSIVKKQTIRTKKVLETQKEALKKIAGLEGRTHQVQMEALAFSLQWVVNYAKAYGTYKNRTGNLRSGIYWKIDTKRKTGKVIAPQKYAGFVEAELNPNVSGHLWVLIGAIEAAKAQISRLVKSQFSRRFLSYSTEKGTSFKLTFDITGSERNSQQLLRLKEFKNG